MSEESNDQAVRMPTQYAFICGIGLGLSMGSILFGEFYVVSAFFAAIGFAAALGVEKRRKQIKEVIPNE